MFELTADDMSTLVAAIIVGLLLGLSERVPQWLIQIGVRRLPEQYRVRLHEEWKAVVDDTPGRVRKLLFAIDLIRGAVAVNRDFAAREQEAKREEALRSQAPTKTTTVTTTTTQTHSGGIPLTVEGKFYGGGYPQAKHPTDIPGAIVVNDQGPWQATDPQKYFEWFNERQHHGRRPGAIFVSHHYSHPDEDHLKNIVQEQFHWADEGADDDEQ